MDKMKKSLLSHYMDPAFIICAVVLLISAIGMPALIEKFGIITQKVPLPIKKSLDLIDEKQLGPYKVVKKQKIANKEIVKSLGTEDYIQWIIEDTEAAPDSPVRGIMLFITYYQLPDRVPHVPEECYTGGGYQRLDTRDMKFNVDLQGDSGNLEEITGRYLVFESVNPDLWNRKSKFTVLYLINTNGVYAGSRAEARRIMSMNVFGKKSFFSKVEWNFLNRNYGQGTSYLNPEEAAKASEKLLSVILPLLEKEHWPSKNENETLNEN